MLLSFIRPFIDNKRLPRGEILQRVGFRNFRAMEPSHAWNYAVAERWTTPARRILRFLSDGTLQHAGFCDSWVMDGSSARDFAFSER